MKLRYPELLYRAVFDIYRKKYDEIVKRGDPEEMQKALPRLLFDNPKLLTKVLYIGPLLDGLVRWGIFASRSAAKSFFGDVQFGVPHNRWRKAEFKIKRAGKSEFVALKYGAVDSEPGEIVNSPREDTEESTPGYTHLVWNPVIREERKFGLHMLFEGDEIEMWSQGRGRDKTPILRRFKLRPLSEGDSELIAQQTSDADLVF